MMKTNTKMLTKRSRLRVSMGVLFLVLLLASGTAFPKQLSAQASREGKLVLVGGGGTPKEVIRKMIEMAGGNDASIVVTGIASENRKSDQELVKFFRSFGATQVVALNRKNGTKARQQLQKAKIVWFGGGDQNRIIKKLNAQTRKQVLESYQRGAIVGGTSAGAAVMATKMITGKARLDSVTQNTTELVTGLQLTDLIVDQHFNKRQRFNRLLSAVLDNPQFIGVGIDERTAVFVDGEKLMVYGESNVVLMDARKANLGPSKQHPSLHNVKDLRVHVLAPGSVFDLGEE